jgi:hypothetical protein
VAGEVVALAEEVASAVVLPLPRGAGVNLSIVVEKTITICVLRCSLCVEFNDVYKQDDHQTKLSLLSGCRGLGPVRYTFIQLQFQYGMFALPILTVSVN